MNNRVPRESQLQGIAWSERRLVQIAGAVLLSVFLITVVQKHIRYGGGADFDAARSLLFNLLVVVPFIAMIGAGTVLTGMIRERGTLIRVVAIVISAAAAIVLYVLLTGALLYALGLSKTWPASPFVAKYVSGALYVHVALYLFVQIAADQMGRVGRDTDSSSEVASSTEPVTKSVVRSVAGIDVGEIRWIESWDHYVKVCSPAGVQIERSTMKKLEEALPSGFVRVHRRHIVNLAHVERTERSGRHLILVIDGKRIRTSASYRKKVETLVAGHAPVR